MKILITGGHGYIARNLKRLLTNKGYIVFAPSHKELDLLNYELLEEYIRINQFDAVIHAATKGCGKDSETFENTYLPNIIMFENISGILGGKKTPLIIFGSGAEFDRRREIHDEYATSIYHCWPIDPYGLSKNIISRRSLYSFTNIWILRLFGCFNYDEPETKFIKQCIQNIKLNKPIKIFEQRMIDFFFLDDIVPIIEKIFEDVLNTQWPDDVKLPKNINLTYNQKHGLIGIAQLIASMMNKPEHEITIVSNQTKSEYTGSGIVLSNSRINLCGLHEGIRRTINELT